MDPNFGKTLMAIGALLMVIGALFWAGPNIPFLGRLPGDIYIENESGGFYAPIATCLIISVILSLLFGLFGGWK